MSLLLANWKLVVIGLLLVAVGMFAKLYQRERDAFNEFKGSVAAIAAAQKADNERLEKTYQENLTTLRKDYEATTLRVRADAVANYLSRRTARVPATSASSSGMPVATSGIRLDDGAGSECGFDSALVQDAAEDAHKLTAWQQYGKLNHLPIKE